MHRPRNTESRGFCPAFSYGASAGLGTLITDGPPSPLALIDIKVLCLGDPDSVKSLLAPIVIAGTSAVRGSEYASVVRQFVNGGGSDLFVDGDQTIEDGGGVNPGFRKHEETDWWLDSLLGEAASYLKDQIDAGTISLKCGEKSEYDLLTDIPPVNKLLRYQDGNMPGASLEFNNTLAGGVGWYGTPPMHIFSPDRRWIDAASVRLTKEKNGSYVVELCGVTLHVLDGFDFWPGSLGEPWATRYGTTVLAFLEINGRAQDVEFDAIWTDTGFNRFGEPRKLIIEPRKSISSSGDGECDPCKSQSPPDSCKVTRRLRSYDPNDIVGPGGFGTEHWISPDQTFHYTIRFENDPKKAEVPAQYVRITQQLSTNLDLRMFRLGALNFGTNLVDMPADRTFFQTQVNCTNDLGVLVEIVASLDLAKGEVTWEFSSIDPATGDFPWDPFIGFLPPNTNGVIGQGFVTYTIKSKADIANGDIVNAQARIFFDYNEPMDTPDIFNTVDVSLPTSTVLPLPLATNVNIFSVRWTGADGYGGAGVSHFDIYASDNGSPWNLWLQNTPSWEQLFVGECGHSYAFYSVARDNVGNVEPAVPAAQASISLLANTPPVLEAISNRIIAVGQPLKVTNVVTEPNAGQQVTFTLASGAPAGMSVNPTNGVVKWVPLCEQGSSSNVITVVATDDGCGNLSSTQSFAVVVTECLRTSMGSAVARVGESGCVPVFLESSDSLTNLVFTLSTPPGGFTNFSVSATAPEKTIARVQSLSADEVQVTLAAQVGQSFSGPAQVAQVCFSLTAPQPSAFVMLSASNILAFRTDGNPVGNAVSIPGRVVVVGEQPLLDCVLDENDHPLLILFGKPSPGYSIDTRTELFSGQWVTALTNLTVTNLSTRIVPPPSASSVNFYRTKRLVIEGLRTSLGNAVARVGDGGCVPVFLESSDGLTNLVFTLSTPPGGFTNVSVSVTAPEKVAARVQRLSGDEVQVTLAAQAGQFFSGPAQVAQVCFSLTAPQPSAFVMLSASNIVGFLTNGIPVVSAASTPGRVVVVDEQPLLDCILDENDHPLLILFGKPSPGYSIDTRTELFSGQWVTALTNLTLTNLSTRIAPPSNTNTVNFYRARR